MSRVLYSSSGSIDSIELPIKLPYPAYIPPEILRYIEYCAEWYIHEDTLLCMVLENINVEPIDGRRTTILMERFELIIESLFEDEDDGRALTVAEHTHTIMEAVFGYLDWIERYYDGYMRVFPFDVTHYGYFEGGINHDNDTADMTLNIDMQTILEENPDEYERIVKRLSVRLRH